MKYVVYYGHTANGTILNMTHNPYLDFTYLRENMGLTSLYILTPKLPVSGAYYILMKIKSSNLLERLLPRGKNPGDVLKSTLIKRIIGTPGIKLLNRQEIITSGCEYPIKESMDLLYNTLKGRIIGYSSILKYDGLFFKEDYSDLLQALYLDGRLSIYPSLSMDKADKKYMCMKCGIDIIKNNPEDDVRCPECGEFYEDAEPLYAFKYCENNAALKPVKYRHSEKTNYLESNALKEIDSFIKGEICECLLWTSSYLENFCILNDAIKNVLDKGGRCLVILSCSGECELFFLKIRESFPHISMDIYKEGETKDIKDIAICRLQDVKEYYKTFDLVILHETPGCSSKALYNSPWLLKRTVKDKGKIIYMTQTPDFITYKNAAEGNIKLVVNPPICHGKPIHEPRVITYRIKWGEDLYISNEVLEYIEWSLNQNIRLRIIVPHSNHISILKDELVNLGVGLEYFELEKPLIAITTPLSLCTPMEGAENIMVFSADDGSVFNEKALLNASGLSVKLDYYNTMEVLFIGSKESSEMYNARMMIRHMNKYAWEMGYM